MAGSLGYRDIQGSGFRVRGTSYRLIVGLKDPCHNGVTYISPGRGIRSRFRV